MRDSPRYIRPSSPYAGKVLVGAIPEGRRIPLGDQNRLNRHRSRTTHNFPEYNEKDRTGLFYAQSWLLTHMLMRGYIRQSVR